MTPNNKPVDTEVPTAAMIAQFGGKAGNVG
jgi:hypothetical protein